MEEFVGPELRVARGAPVAEGLWDERVPGGVEVGVTSGEADVQAVAAMGEVLGV